MLKIEISDTDMQQLRYERFHQLHPRVMLKMEVVYLKGLGLKNDLICQITGVCGNTLREYLKEYTAGGVERLKKVKFYQRESDLKAFSGTIEQYFLENPPRSIGEAAAKIKELTGIERKETQVRKFIKGLKFRFIKVGSAPAKALTEEKK
ncbi:MAG: IS630 family transposase, partial [Dysgonamonadaceae bacterium]|nr:IS630 family transposase [Dysgonamonadaceae bacterium]